MSRAWLWVMLFSMLATPFAPALAGDAGNSWHYFWYGVKRDFHRQNAWPDPFVYPDRASVIAPLALQVQNGWRAQNLLGEYYFDSETQQLTSAGKDRVRWILTQAPPQFRTIFVQRSVHKAQTASRMDAVNRVAAEVMPRGELASVEETNLIPRGWPAEEINNTYVNMIKTAPAPRLPEAKTAE
ncbi:MAG: hypothetical protein WD176_07115 [Pirellulales bacterium]